MLKKGTRGKFQFYTDVKRKGHLPNKNSQVDTGNREVLPVTLSDYIAANNVPLIVKMNTLKSYSNE